jgi:hypothetical protein
VSDGKIASRQLPNAFDGPSSFRIGRVNGVQNSHEDIGPGPGAIVFREGIIRGLELDCAKITTVKTTTAGAKMGVVTFMTFGRWGFAASLETVLRTKYETSVTDLFRSRSPFVIPTDPLAPVAAGGGGGAKHRSRYPVTDSSGLGPIFSA